MTGIAIRRSFVRAGVALGVLMAPAAALAQPHAEPTPDIQSNLLLNLTEVLTGGAAAFVAFQAALAYREGRLGKGLTRVAVGIVVMAVGHFILVARRLFQVDPLGFLGTTGSFVAFSFAVFASFTATAAGFYLIRKAADRSG